MLLHRRNLNIHEHLLPRVRGWRDNRSTVVDRPTEILQGPLTRQTVRLIRKLAEAAEIAGWRFTDRESGDSLRLLSYLSSCLQVPAKLRM